MTRAELDTLRQRLEEWRKLEHPSDGGPMNWLADLAAVQLVLDVAPLLDYIDELRKEVGLDT